MPAEGQIRYSANAPQRLTHAIADLQRYLAHATGVVFSLRSDASSADATVVAVGYQGDNGIGDELIAAGLAAVPSGADGYALRKTGNQIAVVGADLAGAVFGIYGLLEQAYGCGFFLGSEVVPAGTQPIAPEQLDLQRSPAFATRGLLPWYDFISGPSAWNLRDYKLYIDRMVRMGLNFLGLHVYSHGPVNRSMGAEPFLSFEYRGVGHDAYIDTTQTPRWGYQPMRTSQFSFGTDVYYAGEVFGADAAIEAQGSLDAIKRGKALLQEAFAYAKARGMKICLGFEPSAIPLEILRALPENARRTKHDWDGSPEPSLITTSVAAQKILELRLRDLLDTYPEVDAIWLWQNEDAAWTRQRAERDLLPFDAAYIRAAYDYLQAHAPQVQLVVSGWGAVHALFDQMHQELPGDIAFSALNHNLGTSETDEVYGRLGERNRWPIPWLEDDATLWHPQYHIHRFQNDISRAHQFGADGMIGIHWRTRVIDHVTAYFAKALWEPGLDGAAFYRWYCERLVGPEQAEALASDFDRIDREHLWPGYLVESHVSSGQWDGGHSNEAGTAFSPLKTDDAVLSAFSAFADRLSQLPDHLGEAEAERVRYHAAQAEFARFYVASQQAAASIDALVKGAQDEERTLTADELAVANTALTQLAGAVQEAVTLFARVQTTTADLGVLASLSLKYVQRAIWQRYDALREVADDPAALPKPDLCRFERPVRLFVPVPPEVIDGPTEVQAIASDPEIAHVVLCQSNLHGDAIQRIPMTQVGRGVWQGTLQADEPIRYWVEAEHQAGTAVRAPEAAGHTFSAIVA